MLKEYKLALIQMHSEWGIVASNNDKAERYIRQAAANGSKLILLPEMFHCGIDFTNMRENMDYAERIDGPTLTRFRALAAELNVYILCPVLIDTGTQQWENTAFLLGDQGELIGSYAKTHPVGDERMLLQRGTRYPVFETPLGKIGLSICYDVCFPETTRLTVLNGAEILLVVAGWRGSHYFKEWWDINLKCRALDNLVYVAAANACGPTGDGTEMYAGKSQVVNPIGQVQSMTGVEEETIVYQTIYPDRVRAERAFNSVLIDRHPEDYLEISTHPFTEH